MKKIYLLTMLTILFTGIVNAQIVQVTDLNPSGDAGIASPYLYNGEIFFEGDAGDAVSDEFYKITADGSVVLVKDINQDPEDGSPSSDPKNWIEYQGMIYFNANDGDNGADFHDKELWKTDGTTDGTVLAADIWTGAGNGSNPQQMFVFNDKLYMNAKVDAANQVFRYDGTNPVQQITTVRDNGSAVPFFPVVDATNGKVYIKINTGKFHLLVMNSDETYEVIQLNPTDHTFAGTEAGVIYKDKYYFNGDNGTDGDELFVSDGTLAGTMMLKDINAAGDADPEQFVEWMGELYFIAEAATGMQLWKTDGTAEGTVMVFEPNVGGDGDMDHLTLYMDKLYFSATDGTNGVEPWCWNGTEGYMIKNLDGDVTDTDPEGFTGIEGLILFAANDETGKEELWVTDGTEGGTLPVDSLFITTEDPYDIDYKEFLVNGSKLYFTGDDANGDEVFMVDVMDIKAAMSQVTDINKSGDSGIGTPALYNGEIFFEADDGVIGDELYKITADNEVVLVKDINTDAEDTSPNGDPKNFIVYMDKLFFNGNDGDKGADLHDSELWSTDGTTDGTVLEADIWAGGNGNAGNPQQMFIFNNKLYMNAKVDAANQVFRYDGTNPVQQITTVRDNGSAVPFFPVVDEANGKVYIKINTGKFHLLVMNTDETYEVISINPTDHTFAGTEPGIIYKDKFYFNGDNGTDGDELFVSDGTLAGTSMLKDINVGGDSDPEQFVEWMGELYFIAEAATGMQLWKTDGTADGTVIVAEPNVGGDADMDHLKLFMDKLYFAATDGTNGVEVWSYDGSTATMLKNLDEDVTDTNPEGFIEVDGLLFFAADNANGKEVLWVTNGTTEYTALVSDLLNDGIPPIDINYKEFIVRGTVLYYTGDNASGHDDIYMVDANKIWSEHVTFNVSDANGPLAGATVEFDGITATTDDMGMITFEYVRMGADQAYVVSLEDYLTANGTVTVADEAVSVDVVLEALPTYNVEFTVTDGTDPLEGAEIAFNGATGTTDASGVYTFTEVLPATDMAYTITKDGYTEVTGTATVVDQDIQVSEAMTLIVYTVTFNVTDGTNALEGAVVTFNEEDITTDASGVAVFTDVVPGTGLAYSVTLDYRYYDADGTVDVDGDETVDVTLTLTSVSAETIDRMQVYPNPTSGRLYISGIEDEASYEIYNISQQKIAEGILEGARIDLDVEAGMYILKVRSEEKTYISRVIVE